jgi:hypothetical protein
MWFTRHDHGVSSHAVPLPPVHRKDRRERRAFQKKFSASSAACLDDLSAGQPPPKATAVRRPASAEGYGGPPKHLRRRKHCEGGSIAKAGALAEVGARRAKSG